MTSSLRITALAALAVVLAGCAATNALKPYENEAAVQDRLVAMEKQSWVAWQQHDASYFSSLLSDDHIDVGPTGFADKAAVVNAVRGGGCTVQSYSVEDFRVRRVADDAMMVMYRASQNTTCNGAAVPSPASVTSVYARRNGRWQNVLFQQTPVNR